MSAPPQRNPVLANVTYDVAAELVRSDSLTTNKAAFDRFVAVNPDGNVATFKRLPASPSANDLNLAVTTCRKPKSSDPCRRSSPKQRPSTRPSAVPNPSRSP